MRQLTRVLAILFSCGALLVDVVHSNAADKPNFVFIIADDCTFRDIGCYGGQAHTPNIDRLASEGMRLTRCFQAAPMCSPTRHNIYTGLYPVKSGAYPNHTFVKDGVKSIVHYLKPLGYRVALSGKTHINPPEAFPFEYSGRKSPDMEVIGQLMSECAAAETPFCLFACSNQPHTPWNKGDPSRYDPQSLTLPPNWVDTPTTRQQYAKYLAEITYYDAQVGRILSLVDRHGLRDSTLVMVVSEQGSSFPFAKWTLYDSGTGSAMVVRWPGKTEPGSVSDALVEYVDVCPTFVEAAGGRPVDGLDGRSMLAVLQGETTAHKKHVFAIQTTKGINNYQDPYPIRSIRDERYKLILNLAPEGTFRNAAVKTEIFRSWLERAKQGDAHAQRLTRAYQHRPAVEFYDVVVDPYEMQNLADDPRHAGRIAELKSRLRSWMQAQGDEGLATEQAALDRQSWNRRRKRTANRK